MNYFVSVIIPNYCHAKFLDQRIQSVLNQSYRNFEIIILDDNSPDEGASRRVIECYRNNPLVSHIVYNEQNSGSTFRQWNKGFSLARGSLIWIAESDDYCEPDFLQTLVAEFQRDENLSLAFCRSQKVDRFGSPILIKSIDLFKSQHMTGLNFIRKFMVMENFCNNASACLFRKDVAENVDPIYMSFQAAGDAMFWIEVAERGNVSIVKDRLNCFRQHDNKVTPRKALMGVNLKEYKIIYEYLCLKHVLSRRQIALMRDCRLKEIIDGTFANEKVRKDLCSLWQFDGKISLFSKIRIKVILMMRHRLGLYF